MSAPLKTGERRQGGCQTAAASHSRSYYYYIYTFDAPLVTYFLDVFANKLSQKEFLHNLYAIVNCIEVEFIYVNFMMYSMISVIDCVITMQGYNIFIIFKKGLKGFICFF